MKKILETGRLVLQEFTIADDAFILALVNSPNWMAYIGDRQVNTLQAAREYILNGPVRSYAGYGFGLWLIVLKSTRSAVGICGLIRREYLPAADIGYALLPHFEGKGYAFEAAQATVQYARETLQLPHLLAIVKHHHFKSIRLLENLGMNKLELRVLPGQTEELQIMEMKLHP